MEEPRSEWFSALPGSGRIYALIDEAQGSKSKENRINALYALGESDDPRAVRPLVTCCADADPLIRRHATGALYKLRSVRAIDALEDRLKDKNEDKATRLCAAEALAVIQSISAKEILAERSKDPEEDPEIRLYVSNVIERADKR